MNSNINYSDVAVNNVAFTSNSIPVISMWIKPGVTGDIVWQNYLGNPQWLQAAQANAIYYIAATKILSGATVNGTPRLTTATGIIWAASKPLSMGI